ncbi:ATP-dependent DNA helicase Q1 isoform X1 [Takifugu rubripes]|uniref:ATP-dependent DNA helicase n=1 Tax=Takifugu rubripes TaxID=31033 RepID=A0A3B5K8H3_TAKRU|nr:ATP-dependent DNA helicase Q1 isoform X1 [Takifugu rubripes]
MDGGAGTRDVQERLDTVEAELEEVDLQIAVLQQKKAELHRRRDALLQRLEEACDAAQPSSSSQASRGEPAASRQEMQRFDGSDFPWSQEVVQHLQDTFHLPRFRPLQLRAINLTLSGRDVFLVMPTGRGKSLCYQLPALCSKGLTLVVTPLVSLMEDQLMYLQSISVSAAMLNASSSKEHAKSVMAGMTDPTVPFRLVYVTPEKIAKSKLLMSRLEKAYKAELLSRIAVDEVHCCSQWGHDFRPDYKLLGILKRQFPKVPLIGLTATATSTILKDCEKILSVRQPVTITASFNRTNLYYEVRVKNCDSDASVEDMAFLIKSKYQHQSGIVYVFSQKDAESVSSALQKRGILASPYHANMDPTDKSHVHRRWSTNKIQVVVATVAFGMGIDKPDVRFVIHHTISKSIENYYQESGRAGRDDCPADCVIYFGFSDIFRISTMVVMENVGQQKLRQMLDYCQSIDRCRRSLMAVHFDEVWDDEGCQQMCDTCRHPKDVSTVDITQHARQVVQILELAASMDEKTTPLKLVEAWTGRGPAKRRKLIQTTTLSRTQAEAVVVQLLLKDYLSGDFSFTPYTTYFYIKLGTRASLLRNQSHTVSMKMCNSPGRGPSEDRNAGKVVEEQTDVTLESPQLQHKLSKEQRNQSRKQKVKSRLDSGIKEEEKGSTFTHHSIDVNVEILDYSKRRQESSRTVKPKCARKHHSKRVTTTEDPVGSSLSRASVTSEAAVEELCHLRRYYSSQLRRINYVSHEHLGQPAEPGLLACIWEPLRSLCLGRGPTSGDRVRTLWTRVSGWRKLMKMSQLD